MTGRMVNCFSLQGRSDVFASQHFDQKRGEFPGLFGQRFRSPEPVCIVPKQFRIFQPHHGRTRTGRRHHVLRLRKNLHRVPCQCSGILPVAAIEMRLATAGLPVRKLHLHSQTLQQSNRGPTDPRKKHIAQTRDQQSDAHVIEACVPGVPAPPVQNAGPVPPCGKSNPRNVRPRW
jgi:hypothetical protein